MIDHTGIPVSDIRSARAFHAAAPEPLRLRPPKEREGGTAPHFGRDEPEITIAMRQPAAMGVHAAFALDPDGNDIKAVCHKPEDGV